MNGMPTIRNSENESMYIDPEQLSVPWRSPQQNNSALYETKDGRWLLETVNGHLREISEELAYNRLIAWGYSIPTVRLRTVSEVEGPNSASALDLNQQVGKILTPIPPERLTCLSGSDDPPILLDVEQPCSNPSQLQVVTTPSRVEASALDLNQQVGKILTPIPPERLVVLHTPADPPIVLGVEQPRLRPSQLDVVTALIRAGSPGLGLKRLELESGHDDARGILRRLSRKTDEWRRVIQLPGVAWRGYRIALGSPAPA